MTIGQRLKNRREELKLTQEAVAKKVGVAIQTIYKYENEIVTNIPLDRLELLASALEVSPAYLMGWQSSSSETINISKYSNIKPIQLKSFPILGKIACGKPIFADEDKGHYIMADMDIHADFCLVAQGDSMVNARINDGDIVFVRETPVVENGEIAAVIINDEATLKRVYYYPEQNKLVLSAENPKYEPFVYIGTELEHIRILGKAVYFMSAL